MQGDNETISKKLRRIAKLYTDSLSRLLSELDINRYFDVLLTLSAQPEPVTQKSLAALMHFDKTRMVSILNYLDQKGYTSIQKNPKDRREHFISLSAKGSGSIPAIKDAIRKNDERMLLGIYEAEFNDCLKILTAIEVNLKLTEQKFISTV